MKRRLFTLLAAASLLIWLGVAGLWVRSWITCDYFEFCGLRTYVMGTTFPGHIQARICVNYESSYFWGSRPHPAVFTHHQELSSVRDWSTDSDSSGAWFNFHWHGFMVDVLPTTAEPGKSTYRTFYLAAPYWFLILIATITPVLWYRAFQRRAAARLLGTHCAYCGYDLRATPDRCPECGAVPTLTLAGK